MPIVTFLPVVAKSTFGLGARGYSWLLTAYGVGSVLGAILVAASGHVARKGRLALLLQLAFAVTLIAFAFSRVLALSMIIAFFAGACIVGVISMYSSLVQLTTSDAMRGRVMSIFMLAFRGGMPLGSLASGYLATFISAQRVIEINGVLLVTVALYFLVRSHGVREI
jgi:predicted MFS family arabinose efflux permease